MTAFTRYCARHDWRFDGDGCPFCIAEGEPTGTLPRQPSARVPETEDKGNG